MTNDKIRGELIALAAKMAQGKGLPSSFVEDYKWPKTTPLKVIRMVSQALEQMEMTKNDWAYKLGEISKRLK